MVWPNQTQSSNNIYGCYILVTYECGFGKLAIIHVNDESNHYRLTSDIQNPSKAICYIWLHIHMYI